VRAVVTRVTWARVSIEGHQVGACGPGLLVLVAAAKGDSDVEARRLADRVLGLRIFGDEAGKMNLALADLPPSTEPQILVISNFTLYGDAWSSRRPSFMRAAGFEDGNALYDAFVAALRERGLAVATGEFGGDMKVESLNDGPVTLIIDADPPDNNPEPRS